MTSHEGKDPECCPINIESSAQTNSEIELNVIEHVMTSESIRQGIHHGAGNADQPSAKRSDLIEQVMRMTNDDRIVIPFLDAVARSTEILSATGRLLASPPSPFPLGTPLAVWVEPSTGFETHWRSLLPTRERSMWNDLEFYRSIVGAAVCETGKDFCCPYEELEHLRLTASNGLYNHGEN
jgi:hypothetical protein